MEQIIYYSPELEKDTKNAYTIFQIEYSRHIVLNHEHESKPNKIPLIEKQKQTTQTIKAYVIE